MLTNSVAAGGDIHFQQRGAAFEGIEGVRQGIAVTQHPHRILIATGRQAGKFIGGLGQIDGTVGRAGGELDQGDVVGILPCTVTLMDDRAGCSEQLTVITAKGHPPGVMVAGDTFFFARPSNTAIVGRAKLIETVFVLHQCRVIAHQQHEIVYFKSL